MSAIRMKVQTADKNIQIISNPHNSSPSIYTSWSEKLHAYKKQIHPDVFNLLN